MSSSSLIRELDRLTRRIERLERANYTHYRGTSAIDYTTTTLPHHGDFGFQTTDDELQVNCNGTIRAITTAAL